MFPPGQCYFYDPDVGGFHYGPGHPYVQQAWCQDYAEGLTKWMWILNVQDEANEDTNVSFPRYELWAI